VSLAKSGAVDPVTSTGPGRSTRRQGATGRRRSCQRPPFIARNHRQRRRADRQPRRHVQRQSRAVTGHHRGPRTRERVAWRRRHDGQDRRRQRPDITETPPRLAALYNATPRGDLAVPQVACSRRVGRGQVHRVVHNRVMKPRHWTKVRARFRPLGNAGSLASPTRHQRNGGIDAYESRVTPNPKSSARDGPGPRPRRHGGDAVRHGRRHHRDGHRPRSATPCSTSAPRWDRARELRRGTAGGPRFTTARNSTGHGRQLTACDAQTSRRSGSSGRR